MKKTIIRFEPVEVAIMLDNIENYENQLTGKKKDCKKNSDSDSIAYLEFMYK